MRTVRDVLKSNPSDEFCRRWKKLCKSRGESDDYAMDADYSVVCRAFTDLESIRRELNEAF